VVFAEEVVVWGTLSAPQVFHAFGNANSSSQESVRRGHGHGLSTRFTTTCRAKGASYGMEKDKEDRDSISGEQRSGAKQELVGPWTEEVIAGREFLPRPVRVGRGKLKLKR